MRRRALSLLALCLNTSGVSVVRLVQVFRVMAAGAAAAAADEHGPAPATMEEGGWRWRGLRQLKVSSFVMIQTTASTSIASWVSELTVGMKQLPRACGNALLRMLGPYVDVYKLICVARVKSLHGAGERSRIRVCGDGADATVR